jgi:hypothetical protein
MEQHNDSEWRGIREVSIVAGLLVLSLWIGLSVRLVEEGSQWSGSTVSDFDLQIPVAILQVFLATACMICIGIYLKRSSWTLQRKMNWAIVLWWWYLLMLVFLGFSFLRPPMPYSYTLFEFWYVAIFSMLGGGFRTMVWLVIFIGMQLMPMLLVGLTGAHYMQSSTKRKSKIILGIIFLGAGILFFVMPLFYMMPSRRNPLSALLRPVLLICSLIGTIQLLKNPEKFENNFKRQDFEDSLIKTAMKVAIALGILGVIVCVVLILDRFF